MPVESLSMCAAGAPRRRRPHPDGSRRPTHEVTLSLDRRSRAALDRLVLERRFAGRLCASYSFGGVVEDALELIRSLLDSGVGCETRGVCAVPSAEMVSRKVKLTQKAWADARRHTMRIDRSERRVPM